MASGSPTSGRIGSSSSSSSTWTAHENKQFEKALAQFDKDTADRWQNIAQAVGGGKSADEVRRHYHLLLEDLHRIESGRVPIPDYKTTTKGSSSGAAVAYEEKQEDAEEQRLLKYLKLQ